MRRRNKAIVAVVATASLVLTSAMAVWANPEPAEGLDTASIEDMTVSTYGNNISNGAGGRDDHDTGYIYVGASISDGAVDEENSNWADKITEEDGAFSVSLNDEVEGLGFTAVRAIGEETVNVTGNIYLHDDGDGTYDSDFTGMGAAIGAGDGATVYVKDVNFLSEGVARSFANVSNANMIVENSKLITMGAHPFTDFYADYVNTYLTSVMISPPWILGLQGAGRTINLLNNGTKTNIAIADSEVYTGGWAALSTDGMGGTARYYVYNSTIGAIPESEGGNYSGWEILGYEEGAYGSGYGILTIGGTTLLSLYGTNVDGSTFGLFSMGGSATWNGLTAGETYEAKDAVTDEVFYTYEAAEDAKSVIRAVFGASVQADGDISFTDVVFDTEGAAIVYRDGNPNFTLSASEVNSKSGVIMNMIDNDNNTVASDANAQTFDLYLYEEAGFPTEAYETDASYIRSTDTDIDPNKTYYAELGNNEYEEVAEPTQDGLIAYYEKTSPGAFTTLTLENGEYVGDIYNGTGYYGQAPDALEVTIAADATLKGDIALSSQVHGIFLNDRSVDDVIAAIDTANAKHAEITEGAYAGLEDIQYVFIDAEGNVTENKDDAVAIQFTQFTSVEYYLIQQLINKTYYNGVSAINVIVDGTWYPEEVSLITYLEISDTAHVYGDLTNNEDGSYTLVPSDNEVEPGVYGEKFVYVSDPNGSSGAAATDGESAEGESDAEAADGESAEGESAEGESAEGEAPAEDAAAAEGESAEGESAEGESAEGEAPAEDAAAEGESADGESAEGESAEGDAAAEGESAEGESEGEAPAEGDAAAEGESDAESAEGESADAEAPQE